MSAVKRAEPILLRGVAGYLRKMLVKPTMADLVDEAAATLEVFQSPDGSVAICKITTEEVRALDCMVESALECNLDEVDVVHLRSLLSKLKAGKK